jgi:hypothetical protein
MKIRTLLLTIALIFNCHFVNADGSAIINDIAMSPETNKELGVNFGVNSDITTLLKISILKETKYGSLSGLTLYITPNDFVPLQGCSLDTAPNKNFELQLSNTYLQGKYFKATYTNFSDKQLIINHVTIPVPKQL